MSNVLILGGAGFIGSALAAKFVGEGFKTTVVDGLLDRTGAQIKNLEKIKDKINFIHAKVGDLKNLNEYAENSDIIIDSMAWTSHLLAIKDPFYDLELNCRSHLYVIEALRNLKNKKILYLSSRGIYGSQLLGELDEQTNPSPLDIQGVHKLTGEYYYKIYSGIYSFDALALRIANCFGPNQPVEGEDIGLAGSFIKMALASKTIEIFGKNRFRSFIFIDDLCEMIFLLSNKKFKGFEIMNVSSFDISIYELALLIVKLCGSGEIVLKEMPEHVKRIDAESSQLSVEKLKKYLGKIPATDIESAIVKTINHFKERLI